jgi:cytosine deaminase
MTSVDCDLLIRQGRVLYTGDQPLDIAIAGGRIVAIDPHLPHSGRQEIDAQGLLVSPPFVESHIHLDSAMTAGRPRWNESGTLFEGIQIWADYKAEMTVEEVQSRAIATLKKQASQGILFVRTHADVCDPQFIALKGLLAAKEALRDWMYIQVVAFPQDGIYSQSANAELLEESLNLGADAVGGIPHYELTREDGVRSIEYIFALAQKYNKLIDIHCDEVDDDHSRFLEVVTANAIRTGMGSMVTASHTTAFGSYNDAYALKLMGFLSRTDLNFVANPLINITLQGRTDTYPKRRGITRVKELWQQGQNVSLGHDCIQDPWYNLGTGNMLDVAFMAVHACHMTGRGEVNACYDMITNNGAETLAIDEYGIAVGLPANLIILDAPDQFTAIQNRSVARYVISRGQIISKTLPTQTESSL